MMHHKPLLILAILGTTVQFLTPLVIAGSDDKSGQEATKKARPAQLTAIDGSKLKQLVLTEKAAKRLDIQVGAMANGEGKLTTPYSSIVYDSDGGAWVYTVSKPLTYVRQKIVVETIKGDLAYLKNGPLSGTSVVTIGVAELYGTEKGLGH